MFGTMIEIEIISTLAICHWHSFNSFEKEETHRSGGNLRRVVFVQRHDALLTEKQATDECVCETA